MVFGRDFQLRSTSGYWDGYVPYSGGRRFFWDGVVAPGGKWLLPPIKNSQNKKTWCLYNIESANGVTLPLDQRPTANWFTPDGKGVIGLTADGYGYRWDIEKLIAAQKK